MGGLDLGALHCSVGIIDVGNNSIISVENAGNLLKSRSLGLNVEEVDEDKLDSDPDL